MSARLRLPLLAPLLLLAGCAPVCENVDSSEGPTEHRRHCGACGLACARPGVADEHQRCIPPDERAAGELCGLTADWQCAPGYHDLDDRPGCECHGPSPDDCQPCGDELPHTGVDEDCDLRVDEAIPNDERHPSPPNGPAGALPDDAALRRARRWARNATPGSPRRGSALLQGLVRCGRCEYRMLVHHPGQNSSRYCCVQDHCHYGAPRCQSFSAGCLDEHVRDLALAALTPAALELSLRAIDDIEHQREQAGGLWQKRLERCRYEAEHTARQYHAVDPENRLVARSLESAGEEALRAYSRTKEDHRRHLEQQPSALTSKERETISRLAADAPALWHAETTTNAERKALVRYTHGSLGITQAVSLVERAQQAAGEQPPPRCPPSLVVEDLGDGIRAEPLAAQFDDPGPPFLVARQLRHLAHWPDDAV